MLIDFEGVGTATKGILKKSDSNSLVKSPSPAMKEHTNKHDLLIAEFKQVLLLYISFNDISNVVREKNQCFY